jgi:uncharacterized protein
MRIIRRQDCRRMPWMNGGGTTTEILRRPETGQDFDWRVSVADVTEDGPFSIFPGCIRHITVITGDRAMRLNFGGGKTMRSLKLATASTLRLETGRASRANC